MRYVETMNSSQLSAGARICTLGTLSLLMSEIYIDHLNTYSSDNVYLDLTSFFIFGGIALGNVLGFPYRKLEFDIDIEWLLTGALHGVAFLGMIYFRKFAPIFCLCRLLASEFALRLYFLATPLRCSSFVSILRA